MPKKGNNGKKKGKRKGTNQDNDQKISHTWSLLGDPFPAFRNPRLDNQVYNFVRNLDQGTIFTTSVAVPTFGNFAVQLANLPSFADFSSLFDQYRFTRIEYWIYSKPGTTGTTNNLLGSKICTVIDYDDSTNLTSFAQAQEYQSCIMTTLSDGHYRSLTPHVANAVYAGGVFTSFGNMTSPWIDIASSTVPHYGLKVAAEASQVATEIIAQVRVHIQVRNVR